MQTALRRGGSTRRTRRLFGAGRCPSTTSCASRRLAGPLKMPSRSRQTSWTTAWWALSLVRRVRRQEPRLDCHALLTCLAVPWPIPNPHPPSSLTADPLFGDLVHPVCVALGACLKRCWEDDVILPALLYRFWRLTLQVGGSGRRCRAGLLSTVLSHPRRASLAAGPPWNFCDRGKGAG